MKNLIIGAFLLAIGFSAKGQSSSHALRFYGTGVGPPGFQDRLLIPLDDNSGGPDASAPADIGSGSFTMEVWIRGQLANNSSSHSGGDASFNDVRWIEGNIILDRDIWCGSERKFGVSIAGGYVRFGTSRGDSPGQDAQDNTIEGNIPVLNDQWNHIAVVRDAATGRKSIYVNGVLDFQSATGVSQANLSYPDSGIPVTGNCGTGQLTPYGWYLVLAAEKHDAGASYPSFNGYMDELRIWNVARTSNEIASTYAHILPYDSPGLVGYYRFEEGAGTNTYDSSSANSYAGQLRNGVAGNGEWVSYADHPQNTAPVQSPGTPPPAPVIIAPNPGDLYTAGGTVLFDGFATNEVGGPVAATSLTWRLVRQYGDSEQIIGTPISGTEVGSFIIPTNGFNPESDRFAVRLTVSDTNNLTTSTTHSLDPQAVMLHLDTVPPGLSLSVNGISVDTPRAFTSVVGFAHAIWAPMGTEHGTAMVFSCWSDAGSPTNQFVMGTNALSLIAGYRPSPGGDIESDVGSSNRNAEYYSGTGQQTLANQYDSDGLCAGRDGGGYYQSAMSFQLTIPQGATILDTRVRVTATADQTGSPPIAIRAYNSATVSAFTNGASNTLLTHHPVFSETIIWNPGVFVGGQSYESVDLTPLVQAVVDRPDWQAGQYLGLIFDGNSATADAWRCWRNQPSGHPPTLLVSYTTGFDNGDSDIDGDGLPDDWEVLHGLNCVDPADALLDPDGDGATSLAEYIAGTNPTNILSRFQWTDIIPSFSSNGGTELRWNSVSGRVYTIYATTNLALSPSQPIAVQLPATPPQNTWTNNNPADGIGIFFLEVEWP